MVNQAALLKFLAYFATPYLCIWILSPAIGPIATIVSYLTVAALEFGFLAILSWALKAVGGPMEIAKLSGEEVERRVERAWFVDITSLEIKFYRFIGREDWVKYAEEMMDLILNEADLHGMDLSSAYEHAKLMLNKKTFSEWRRKKRRFRMVNRLIKRKGK